MSHIIVMPAELTAREDIWRFIRGCSCEYRPVFVSRHQYDVAREAGKRYAVAIKMA